MAYANSVDPDQTAPDYLPFYQIFEETIDKKQTLDQKVWNKEFEILGHLL